MTITTEVVVADLEAVVVMEEATVAVATHNLPPLFLKEAADLAVEVVMAAVTAAVTAADLEEAAVVMAEEVALVEAMVVAIVAATVAMTKPLYNAYTIKLPSPSLSSSYSIYHLVIEFVSL